MNLMSANIAPPRSPAHTWSMDTVKQNLRCGICYVNDINHWNSCQRRMAIINLHPGFSSRPRQLWFIIMQIIKYLPIPETYRAPKPRFRGNVRFRAFIRQDQTRNPNIPTHIHNAKLVVYGKLYLIYVFNSKKYK